MLKVYGLGGDAQSAPSDTPVAYWAALAAGARGLVVNVHGAGGAELRCAPASVLDGAAEQDFERFDAGGNFRSRGPEQGQDDRGAEAFPWRAGDGRSALRHPRLRDVLRIFGRRTSLVLRLPQSAGNALVQALAALLSEFGLTSRVKICAPLAVGDSLSQSALQQVWIAEVGADGIAQAARLGAKGWGWAWKQEDFEQAARSAEQYRLPLWLLLPGDAGAIPPAQLAELRGVGQVAGVLTASALATVEALEQRAVVFRDSLESTQLDREQWAAGYSRLNSETSLEPRADGFHVVIAPGLEYSGGGLVTRFPLCGAFDARVTFRARSLQQGSTFELAAIALDPGFGELDVRKLTSSDVHLSFDVHGAPPYASSERDEDNGYRFGWNNASNLTRILEDWSHASGNMYNEYGRDVGPGPEARDNVTGQLRLIRSGSVFASYFKDRTTPGWVCSGAGLVSTMPADTFIRVAAKHWRKGGREPPANQIAFSDFVLRQP